jgi:MFS family permease
MRAVANHHRPRMRHRVRQQVHHVAARYREARRSLRIPASAQSRRGLDWTNFFIADAQTAFGTFVAVYLAQSGWSEGHVGLALAAGTIAGVLSQLPGGALADVVRWKRGLAALGILMVASAALILAFTSGFAGVFAAAILQGSTAGVVTPAITAISLGLVGRQAISVRAGRNVRYAAAGGALTAALMGALGSYISGSAIFLFAAALCVPALIALSRIRGEEIDYAKARNAGSGAKAASVGSIFDLAKNRRLVLFAAALTLFQLADASMLPLLGENLAGSLHGYAAIAISGLIIVPQIVVAILAPWVGLHCELKGRRPLLLVGFALEPIRAVLLALATGYGLLVVAQILSGVTGAIIGVLTVLVITDLTAGTGRFNLAIGAVGALSGIAASISTSTTGFLFQALGPRIGYLPLAAVAAAATGVLWVFLAETKPEKYEE